MIIKGVVFDMDGLMFDTENLTCLLQKRIFDKRGIAPDYDLEWYKQTVGKRTEDIEGLFKDLCGGDFDFADFRAECREVYEEYTEKHGVPVKRGLFELLDLLKEKQIKTALATSTAKPSAVRTLRISGTLPYFDALVCAEDVQRGKPYPDPFLKAAEKLGLKPESCLALEDSVNGIKSAYSAGMITVMVPDLIEPTDEIRPMCRKILPSLNEVKEYINASKPR